MFQHDALAQMIVRQPAPHIRNAESTTPAQTVHVIDDNASLRRALGRLLTSFNWPVRMFDSAEAFLAELGRLSSGCVVTDVQLPGMSGLDLVRRLTEFGLSWPIIVMSGLRDTNIESEALRLGARAYLRKPFNSQALLDEIAKALL
jgi:two-component system response regulator FixJ